MKNLPLVATLILAGCASNVERFYKPIAGPAGRSLPAYSGSTRIVSIADPPQSIKEFRRTGYVVLGVSGFHITDNVTEAMVQSQAKKVGADIVLHYSKYLGAGQGMIA